MITELRWIKSTKYGGKFVLQMKFNPDWAISKESEWTDIPMVEVEEVCGECGAKKVEEDGHA